MAGKRHWDVATSLPNTESHACGPEVLQKMFLARKGVDIKYSNFDITVLVGEANVSRPGQVL